MTRVNNCSSQDIRGASRFWTDMDRGMQRLIAIGVVETLAASLYASLLAPWYKSLGYESAAQGWLSFLLQITSAVVAIAGGILADRLGRKRMYTAGQVIRCAVPIFLLLTQSFVGLVIVSVLRGLTSIQKPAERAFMGSYTKKDTRATTMAIHQTAYLLAAMIGPMIAGFLADLYGVKPPIVLGLVLALVAIIMAIPIRDPIDKDEGRVQCESGHEEDGSQEPSLHANEPEVTKTFSERTFLSGAKELFSRPTSFSLVLLLVASLTNGFANGAVNILLPFTVMDKFSSGYTAVTALTVFSSLGTALVTLVGGRIADIKGRRDIILIPGGIFPFLMLSIIWIEQLWQVYALLLLITMVGNISGPATQALNMEMVEPKYLATWSGFLMCASALGMGVGSIAGGAMYYLDPDMAWIATVVLFASSVVCYYLVLKKQALGDELSA